MVVVQFGLPPPRHRLGSTRAAALGAASAPLPHQVNRISPDARIGTRSKGKIAANSLRIIE